MDRTRRRLVVTMVAAGLSACQYDPYTMSYARKRPDEASLVAVWTPTADTARALATSPSAHLKPRIEIRADGTISIRDTPDAWRSMAETDSGSGVNFEGRWKLKRQQDTWWDITLEGRTWNCSGCLGIMNQEPPYILVLRYGDPDGGKGHEFERAG
jgi:hypothetical protein